MVIEDARNELDMPNLRLFGGTGIEDARTRLSEGKLDHVVMGAGIDLETRLDIVREVFWSSDSTTVHSKDRISGKHGVPALRPFRPTGLDDYEDR